MNLYIIGAGGFGSEVEWLVSRINHENNESVKFQTCFVNQLLDNPGNTENSIHCGLEVIGGIELKNRIKNSNEKVNIAISIGNPGDRKRIYSELKSDFKQIYPILIDPSTQYDVRPGRIKIGDGTILCAGSILTTNIIIGSFVHINIDCTIGHDSQIGDFSTISPGVHISGHVHVADSVFIGTGAVILPNIKIGSNCKVGAGAVVTKDVPANTLVVGIPAKPII